MVMTNKAYIVVNEQQEREVLEKLEREGCVWHSNSTKPTEYIPSKHFIIGEQFPTAIVKIFNNRIMYETNYEDGNIKQDEEIIYDGRKEEKMSDKLNRTLVIFTNNGQSFMFKHVTDFKYTTTGFEFSYAGEMTGVERHAVFNNTSIAGYALSD